MINNAFKLVITEPQLDGDIQIARGETHSQITGTVNCCPEQLSPYFTVTSAAVPINFRPEESCCFYEVPAMYQQAGFRHVGNIGIRCNNGKVDIAMLDCSGDIKLNASATITFHGAIV